MAVSPSTIVLGILTCIPFGLAIRDTVKGTPAGATADDDEYNPDRHRVDREALEAELERDAEIARAERERQREEERKVDDVIEALFDTSPGNLSTKFTMMTGQRVDVLPEAVFPDETTFEEKHELDIHTEVVDGVLHSIAIEPRMGTKSRPLCDRMTQWFSDNWGEADTEQTNRKVWMYTTLKRRAVLLTVGGSCKVLVERTSPVDEWIAKTPESVVPLWAIGQTPAQVASTLKLTVPTTGDTFEWKSAGLGASTGKTELVAYVKGGKIAAIVAHASHSYDPTAVVSHFEALFGAVASEEPYTWKVKPPVTLDVSGNRISVTVGKVPE